MLGDAEVRRSSAKRESKVQCGARCRARVRAAPKDGWHYSVRVQTSKKHSGWRGVVKNAGRDPRIPIGFALVFLAAWLIKSASAESRQVYIGSAIALLVAGVAQLMPGLHDLASKGRERRKSLDETRRVCLMVIAAPFGTVFPEAAATAINALTYHSRVVDSSDAVGLILLAGSGGGSGLKEEMKRYVNALCRELGDVEMFPNVGP
jgi:hypothetical protein